MNITALTTQAARFMRRTFARSSATIDAATWREFDDSERDIHQLTFIASTGVCVATRVVVASTFVERFVGLLTRKMLADDEGMLFHSGGSIHTFGMRFAIDVLFLDRHMRVLKAAPAVDPWRCVLAPAATQFALELAAGRIAAVGIGAGMRLLWSETDAN